MDHFRDGIPQFIPEPLAESFIRLGEGVFGLVQRGGRLSLGNFAIKELDVIERRLRFVDRIADGLHGQRPINFMLNLLGFLVSVRASAGFRVRLIFNRSSQGWRRLALSPLVNQKKMKSRGQEGPKPFGFIPLDTKEKPGPVFPQLVNLRQKEFLGIVFRLFRPAATPYEEIDDRGPVFFAKTVESRFGGGMVAFLDGIDDEGPLRRGKAAGIWLIIHRVVTNCGNDGNPLRLGKLNVNSKAGQDPSLSKIPKTIQGLAHREGYGRLRFRLIWGHRKPGNSQSP